MLRRASVLGLGWAWACASLNPTFEWVSAEDHWVKAQVQPTQDSRVVDAHRTIVTQTVYTECPWAPSDGRFFRAQQQRCGILPAGALGIGRVLLEPSLSRLSYPRVAWGSRVLFEDFPGACGP